MRFGSLCILAFLSAAGAAHAASDVAKPAPLVTVSFENGPTADARTAQFWRLAANEIKQKSGLRLTTNQIGEIVVALSEAQVWHGRVFYAVSITPSTRSRPQITGWTTLSWCEVDQPQVCARDVARKAWAVAFEQ
jgi:hypothetical protein